MSMTLKRGGSSEAGGALDGNERREATGGKNGAKRQNALALFDVVLQPKCYGGEMQVLMLRVVGVGGVKIPHRRRNRVLQIHLLVIRDSWRCIGGGGGGGDG